MENDENVAITDDSLITFGGAIKALGDGKVGGHLILFGDPEHRDFYDDYFTAETYYGQHEGDGADVMVHHGHVFKSGVPELDKQFSQFAAKLLPPMKTKRDTLGIWAETVLNLADEYERVVYDLCERGVFKWSSGTAPHMVLREADGQIKRWPIIEGSLTPVPAEPRMVNSRVMPLKSLLADEAVEPVSNDNPTAQLAIKTDKLSQVEMADESATIDASIVPAEDSVVSQKSAEISDENNHSNLGDTTMVNVVLGSTKMTLLEAIKKLVPRLSEDQISQITTVIELAGSSLVNANGNSSPIDEIPSDSTLEFKSLASLLKDMGYITLPPAPETKSVERPVFEADAPRGSDDELKKFNAIYHTRFGEEDEIKSVVLKDLLGQDYRNILSNQYDAFWKYMRFGERSLNGDEMKLLKMQVFPSEGIVGMVRNGITVNHIKDVMNETQGTLGGYAVPPAEQQAIISRLPNLTAVRGAGANVISLASQNTTEIPLVELSEGDNTYPSAMRGKWGSEIQSPDSQNMSMRIVPVTAEIYTYKVPMSQSLVEDAANLVQLLQRNISETMAIDEDYAYLTGDGAGKPLGILPGGANTLGLNEVVTGHASELTAAGIMKLKRGITAVYRGGQSVAWIANGSTWAAVEALKPADGTFYFPELSISDRILNRPARESEAMPDVAANAFPILFGDYSGYSIVERLGLTIVRFQDSYTGINKVEYHVRRRVGGRLVEPWKFAVQKVSA